MSTFKINYGSNKKQLFDKKPVSTVNYSSKDPDIEQDSMEELSDLQLAFREKAKKEAELKKKNTGSEFWSCIVFQDENQRNEFYRLLGIKEGDLQYINGKKLIEGLKLNIATTKTKAPGKFKCNQEILNISIKPDSLT
ncbi:MAG: hypothetical protein J7527_01645 [Chitinophagaceae bacterium]|nr:hypothetical protein [Chitinophagaceae bacterium]